MKKSTLLFIILLLLTLTISSSIYYFSKKETRPQSSVDNQKKEIQHPPCLADNEWASFEIEREGKYGEGVGYYKGKAIISIKEKNTNRLISSFQIENIDPSHAYPLEIHKCGVYTFRWFDLDERTNLYKKYEFWHYTYNGKGKKIFSKKDLSPYSLDFRIDETETYLALVRGWVGEPENHALVIKDLKTMKDKYVITLKELMEKYPDIRAGTIALDAWGGEKYGSNDFFNFHLLNPERTGFNLNINTGEIKIFR